MRLWRSAGICVAACGLALAGCGTSENDQVRAKVLQFAEATANKDYKTICDQVLAPALVARLTENGFQCAQALQVALGNVKDPMLSIGLVTIHKDSAVVIALTTAQNQRASVEPINLVKIGAGWRISSLGSSISSTGGP